MNERDIVFMEREDIYKEIVKTITNYEIPEDEEHRKTEEE